MTTTRSPWRGRMIALVGITLLAFSLRTAVASLSPLLDLIAEDFPLSAVTIGLIGTAPPVCYAIFGLLTPAITARIGLERSAVLALVLIVAGLFGRALIPNATLLLVLTAVLFAGVAIGNVLLPPLVKKYFPDRMSAVMTLYTTMLALSTFLPPLLAVPMAEVFDWRVSLGWWGIFSAVALVPWFLMILRDRMPHPAESDTPAPTAPPTPQHFGRMLTIPLAWSILVVFATSATLAYVGFAWLPVIFAEHAGVDAATAGALLSLYAAMGLPASLVTSILVVRFRATRPLFLVAVGATIVGILGLTFLPHAALVLWVVLFGMQGVLFPLGLVLIGIRARGHESAIGLSGFVQSVGYAVAALFPFVMGVVRDATGTWVVPLLVLVAVAVFSIPFGIIAGRATTVEQEWERRRGQKW